MTNYLFCLNFTKNEKHCNVILIIFIKDSKGQAIMTFMGTLRVHYPLMSVLTDLYSHFI